MWYLILYVDFLKSSSPVTLTLSMAFCFLRSLICSLRALFLARMPCLTFITLVIWLRTSATESPWESLLRLSYETLLPSPYSLSGLLMLSWSFLFSSSFFDLSSCDCSEMVREFCSSWEAWSWSWWAWVASSMWDSWSGYIPTVFSPASTSLSTSLNSCDWSLNGS